MDTFNRHKMFFYRNMWLLKVSMQNESGPEAYFHFCEQDVTWSFYNVVPVCCQEKEVMYVNEILSKC